MSARYHRHHCSRLQRLRHDPSFIVYRPTATSHRDRDDFDAPDLPLRLKRRFRSRHKPIPILTPGSAQSHITSTLERRPQNTAYEALAANRKWIAAFTYIWTAERALRGGRRRSVLAAGSRLVDECHHDGAARHRCPHHGDLATRKAGCIVGSLGSHQLIHQRTVPAADGRSRRHLKHEPLGQRLGQCGDGEFLLFAED